MRVTPVPFTASGLLVRPAYTDPAAAAGNLGRETTDGPITATEPADTGFTTDANAAGTSLLTVDATHGAELAGTITGEISVVGLSSTGFTKVTLHDGVDNTGNVIMVLTGDGNVDSSYEIWCRNGLYVEVAGTGKGTVMVA